MCGFVLEIPKLHQLPQCHGDFPSLPPRTGPNPCSWGGVPGGPGVRAGPGRGDPGPAGGPGGRRPLDFPPALSSLAGKTASLEVPAPKLLQISSSSGGATAFSYFLSGSPLHKWYKNHRKTYGFCMILNIRTEATLRRFSCAFEATPDPTKTPQDPQQTHPEHPRTPPRPPKTPPRPPQDRPKTAKTP